MANILNQDVWTENVYLIDENDPVQGGEHGVDNLPHKQLTNRTNWLRKQIELLQSSNDHHSAIQQIQSDLAQEIQDRMLADNQLRGDLPSGLANTTFKTLLDKIHELSQKIQVLESRQPQNLSQFEIDSDVVIDYEAVRGNDSGDHADPPRLTIHGITSSDDQLVYLSNQGHAKHQGGLADPILTCSASFRYPKDLLITDRSQVVITNTDRQVAVGVDTFHKILTLTIDLDFSSGSRSQQSLHIEVRQG